MKILLLDHYALFRAGMKHILVGLDEDNEIIEAENYISANEIIDHGEEFDLGLVDLGKPGSDNFTELETLCRKIGEVPVVVVSGILGVLEIRRALDCGALGFIPKTLNSKVALSALRLVLSGGVFLPTNFLDTGAAGSRGPNSISQIDDEGKDPLTCRQRDVLDLMLEGGSNKEIARALHIAEGTVKLHVRALFKVLEEKNRTQAVVRASSLGLGSMDLTQAAKFSEF